MKRLDYETLAMEEVAVEMECGFLAASIVNEKTQSTVEATGQEGITFEQADGGIEWE